MSRLGTVRRLMEYDRLVYDRYDRAVRRRGWKAATLNRETGHLSLKNTLVHILNVHEAWLVAVAQGRWDIFDQPGRRSNDVRSWADLSSYKVRVRVGTDDLMEGLTEAALLRRVKAPWMPGSYTLEDAFYQVSFEQAHHIGEIIASFWRSDWKPPAMTWIENQPIRSARR